MDIFPEKSDSQGHHNDRFKEWLSAANMNGFASEALDLEDILLRCFSVNVFLFPPGTTAVQAVSTPGGAVIVGYQAAGIQMANCEPSA